jgi:hypothetical protein
MSNMSRSVFPDKFGADQVDIVQTCAAVNHDTQICYFSAWTNRREKDSEGSLYYVVQEDHRDRGVGREKPQLGRNDQDEEFDLVFNHGYSARIYFVDAENVDAVPRSINGRRTSFFFEVDLIKEPGRIIAYPQKDGRIETPGESVPETGRSSKS